MFEEQKVNQMVEKKFVNLASLLKLLILNISIMKKLNFYTLQCQKVN